MEIAMDEVLKQGKLLEATMCYTGDILDPKRDKYTLQYYINMAKELEKRGAHLLCIKTCPVCSSPTQPRNWSPHSKTRSVCPSTCTRTTPRATRLQPT